MRASISQRRAAHLAILERHRLRYNLVRSAPQWNGEPFVGSSAEQMDDTKDDSRFTRRLMDLLVVETILWTGLLTLGLVFNLGNSPVGLLVLGALLLVTVYATVSRRRNRGPKA
jgi:hypothetical protein